MRKSRWFLLLAGAVLLVAAGVVPAATGAAGATEVGTVLDAKQEVPKPTGTKAGAAGLFSGTIKGGKITWRLTFTKLSGPASGGAHIHLGARGKAGDVVVALCGPCRNGQTGSAAIPAAAVAAIKRGGAYVNVHTGKNAAGEIRGQLVVVG